MKFSLSFVKRGMNERSLQSAATAQRAPAKAAHGSGRRRPTETISPSPGNQPTSVRQRRQTAALTRHHAPAVPAAIHAERQTGTRASTYADTAQPLTLSPPIPLCLYALQYWSNPPFLNFWHSGALALSPQRQSARMSTSLPKVIWEEGRLAAL